MEQSAEVREAVRHSYEALAKGDGSFFSQQAGVLMVGTDPGEWWAGNDTVIRVIKTAREEMGPHRVAEGDIKAYSDGNVGWADDRPTVHLSDGTTIPMRVTAVLLKENSDWKFVQLHVSIGTPNEDIFGREITIE